MNEYVYKDSIINLAVMAIIEKGRENHGELKPVIIFKNSNGFQFHIAFSTVKERDAEFDTIMFLLQTND